MPLQAVITADIVNSTKLDITKERKLISTLTNLFSQQKMEFYRGDSFQAYVKDPGLALRLGLLARTAAIGMTKDSGEVSGDIRMSIGIGNVDVPVRALNTAKGEAFVLSGRGFDAMTGWDNRRLALVCENPLAHEGLQVVADFLNEIFDTMTGKQAEVIFELLKGEMQKSVAKKLKKTKSTIHQLAMSGDWYSIERILQHYENIIHLIL